MVVLPLSRGRGVLPNFWAGGSWRLLPPSARPDYIMFYDLWVAYDQPFVSSCCCQTIATRVWGPPGLTVCLALGRLGENTVVIMARGRGSRSLSVCVASSGPPGCGDITRVRLHCTVGVIKPFVVQSKIR